MSHKTGEIYVQFIRLLQSPKAALHKDMQKHHVKFRNIPWEDCDALVTFNCQKNK
jgi:hypothetical protein